MDLQNTIEAATSFLWEHRTQLSFTLKNLVIPFDRIIQNTQV